MNKSRNIYEIHRNRFTQILENYDIFIYTIFSHISYSQKQKQRYTHPKAHWNSNTPLVILTFEKMKAC